MSLTSKTMPATKHISQFDIVELTEPVGKAAAGTRGGVLDLLDDGMAMVELTSLPASVGVDRIVVVPLKTLGLVNRTPHHT